MECGWGIQGMELVWQEREDNESEKRSGAVEGRGQMVQKEQHMTQIPYSLSVIMPAHNEEVVIAETVRSASEAVSAWTQDFEIIVVNDGSQDSTRTIFKDLPPTDPHILLLTHKVNPAYAP